ncbi:DCN1 2 [Micractinium conductrix]|uniref:Defective in cullin neddylation protein n=1 Tax=Micractinium conductrix TaxID=554055 RepID=A0A2P6VE19_9CHLO|nr:DCN1 2 [Micractinium conductrix]|eukprot:PSC72336.1 DCN1 2 [Micractinium conductrix]
MNRQQKERLAQFQGITGADAGVASRCLEAAGWSMEAAIDVYYSNGMHLRGAYGPRIDKNAIQRLYKKYSAADGEENIGVEGISLLCSDLGVEPDDAVVLVLSWHLGAEAMCEYTRQGFEEGMVKLGCDSIDKLRAKLPTLRAELQDPPKFREIYQFAYVFSREKGQKIVQLDVALAMWDLLLPPSRWQHIEAWKEFLHTHHKRAVSRDTWNQLLDFIQATKPDFSNYDDSSAWPYLLDEFVEEMRKQQQQQQQPDPITQRAAAAALFLRNGPALTAAGMESQTVNFGDSGEVTMYEPASRELVLVFKDSGLSDGAGWATGPKRVPTLEVFVYTSEAPAELVDAWAPLSNGSSTAGLLADAVAGFASEDPLTVTCLGEGPAGGLAMLCGVWAAIEYPMANADVATFATPYQGFNPQFAWSFEQLVVLHHLWPFNIPAPVLPAGVDAATALPRTLLTATAAALKPLINKETLPVAVVLPNLPEFAPKDLQEPGKRTFEEIYSALGPDPNLPPEYQMPESDCPIMFCKTRFLLRGSCLGFRDAAELKGLPSVTLKDNKTNADAIAVWDNATDTAYLLWKYTEESRDWLTDAAGIQIEGFIEESEDRVEGREDTLLTLVDDPETHQGFTNQFRSLVLSPKSVESDMYAQLMILSGGKAPRRVACSGFSLGAALSELCGVWSAITWPSADVTVANQGGPIPGSKDFKLLFEALVGRAYKYAYRMDIVNSAPPLAWYKRVPATIWINDTQALLQDRPFFDFLDLSWDDHTCDTWTNPKPPPEGGYTITGYVPRLYNVTRPSIPAWFGVQALAWSGVAWMGARLLMQQQQSQADEGPRPECESCGGSGTVECWCSRWSDGDGGCSTCRGSGRMVCSSCRGGGTAVPIEARIVIRNERSDNFRQGR